MITQIRKRLPRFYFRSEDGSGQSPTKPASTKFLRNGVVGFTLIELMLTVTILSIGVTMILKSFFTVTSALNRIGNKIIALRFIDAQMAYFHEKAINKENILVGETEAAAELKKIGFQSRAYLSPVFYEKVEEEAEEVEIKGLKEVNLIISWKEANQDRQETLSAYLEVGE